MCFSFAFHPQHQQQTVFCEFYARTAGHRMDLYHIYRMYYNTWYIIFGYKIWYFFFLLLLSPDPTLVDVLVSRFIFRGVPFKKNAHTIHDGAVVYKMKNNNNDNN
jgi:hypothetical protein